MARLFRLLYVSKMAHGLETIAGGVVIRDILSTARSFNAQQNITGVLIFSNDSFAQILEGPEREVKNLFENIKRDERHYNVIVIQRTRADQRLFSNWSMGYIGVGKNERLAILHHYKEKKALLERVRSDNLCAFMYNILRRSSLTQQAFKLFS